MPFVVEYREDVDTTPIGRPAPSTSSTSASSRRARHARRRHHRRQRHVRQRRLRRRRPGRQDRLRPGLHLGRRLHRRRAHRRHGRPGDQPRRRRRQHVDRRPARAQRRQQRPRHPLQRADQQYGVQMFISAGNSGPGVNTVGDPSVAERRGQRRGRASARRPGWPTTARRSASRTTCSTSPRAARARTAASSRTSPPPARPSRPIPMWQPGGPVPRPATPCRRLRDAQRHLDGRAAGRRRRRAAAVGRQGDRPGRHPGRPAPGDLPLGQADQGVPTHAQGNGMFDVPGAWKLLAGASRPPRLHLHAPVCTRLSGYPGDPEPGHRHLQPVRRDRGRSEAGRDARRYTVKRHPHQRPGSAGASTTSALRSATTARSSRRRRSPCRSTRPSASRWSPSPRRRRPQRHHDDQRPGDQRRRLRGVAVVVAASEAKAPAYAFTTSGSVDRNSFKSYFVTVPEGAERAAGEPLRHRDGSQTRFIAFSPYGVPVESTSSLTCYTNFSPVETCNPLERTTPTRCRACGRSRSSRGVPRRRWTNPFKLDAKIQGVTVEPSEVHLASVTAGEATAVSWNVTNSFGPVTVTGQGGPLSAPRRAADHHRADPEQFEVRSRRAPPASPPRSATPRTRAPTWTSSSTWAPRWWRTGRR